MSDEPTCFIVMPVSTPEELARKYEDAEHFRHVLEQLFVPAVERAGLRPIPPTVRGSAVIHAEIVRNLATADLVLCDMTFLNANVFFELGIRTALDLPACHVRDEHVTAVAFDVNGVNYHSYDGKLTSWNIASEVERLALHLQEARDTTPGRNPMWNVFGLELRAGEPTASESPADAKLDLILKHVTALKSVSSNRQTNGRLSKQVSMLVAVQSEMLLSTSRRQAFLAQLESLAIVDDVEAYITEDLHEFEITFRHPLGPTARTKLRRKIESILAELGVELHDIEIK